MKFWSVKTTEINEDVVWKRYVEKRKKKNKKRKTKNEKETPTITTLADVSFLSRILLAGWNFFTRCFMVYDGGVHSLPGTLIFNKIEFNSSSSSIRESHFTCWFRFIGGYDLSVCFFYFDDVNELIGSTTWLVWLFSFTRIFTNFRVILLRFFWILLQFLLQVS